MAREQPNQLDEIRGLINEHLSTERGSMLLNGLVDYFLETNSAQAMHILSSVREPHDKHLLDKMNECMTKQACRLPTLTLLGPCHPQAAVLDPQDRSIPSAALAAQMPEDGHRRSGADN
ncbi:hypothetical protein KUCAC02_009069 [Chaenocephalus aceratus]|uniref:Uncharacterized protein n=1 Tax=Chaenocephalus aceratus TaxID=36190 RepID=A0ACB9WTA6_CHAAC|nr:hypothetical protein KUCAC02_009069 [Chaenocephalus aceratus]